MDKIDLKHLSGYLPYQLQCQYLGITNGSEISKKIREYEKENQPYTNWGYFEEIPFEYGLKIGYLKEIKIFKDYWKCFIGIKHTGLKSFYNGTNFKPILRPLSDLTNDIYDFIYNKECDYPSIDNWINLDTESRLSCKFSYEFWQLLYQYHFDIHDLIGLGLAIDINTF